jgi:hypothetical protein
MLKIYEKHRKTINKFVSLILILSAYFYYLTLHFGAATGVILIFLTWSFFVLCTPIADAGFLLDFPLRFFLGVRMIISEMLVWVLAISGNIVILIFNGDEYQKTFLTRLFYKILTTPNPYWIIIVLSGIGTFLSIKFGDDVYDEVSNHGAKHKTIKNKNFKIKILSFMPIFAVVLFIYYHLLQSLGINING